MDPGLLTAPSEGERGILAALIGMINHAVRASLPERHVQRLEHQLSAPIALHRLAQDPAAENVEHPCHIEEAGPGWNIGYIRHPCRTSTRPKLPCRKVLASADRGGSIWSCNIGKKKIFASIRSTLFGTTEFVFCCDYGQPSGVAAMLAMTAYTASVSPRQLPVGYLSSAGLS
jgi:hypothetical protein